MIFIDRLRIRHYSLCMVIVFTAPSVTQNFLSIYKVTNMSDHVYKKIEITGSSTKGSDDAVKKAIAKASKSIKNMDWFEVVEVRGNIEDGVVAHWQVTLKIGFRLKD